MSNIRNLGIAVGRLTKDPVVFNNSDGSKKVMITLAVQDNFKGADGTRGTQFLALEAFVSKAQKDLGAYGYMNKGDLIGLEYTVRTNNYTDKAGVPHYGQILLVQSVDLMESKKAAEARKTTADIAVEEDAVPFPG